MPYSTIEFDRKGPVAILSLNRPAKLNAINPAMIEELNHALDQIEANDAVHAIVIHGNGRAFCAGFDLHAGIEANRSTEADWRKTINADLKLIMRFWNSPKPTIAAVHGHALAGGFSIALACDMTVCEEGSLFGEPELRFGSSIVALLLPWYVNPKRAKQMLLTGRDRMGADEAFLYGIVNEIVAESQARKRAIELAREVSLMDPDSVRLTKRAINQTYDIMGLQEALRKGADTSVKIETLATELRQRFNQILRGEGLQAALKWRTARLDQDE